MNVDRTAIELVKTVALAQGLRISEDLLSVLGGPSTLTVHEYPTTGGITLLIGDDVYVNAPFDEPFCSASPLELVETPAGYALRLDELEVLVAAVLPLPGYIGAVDAEGDAVAVTTMSHADRIRVSPLDGCAYNCRFCDLATARYVAWPVERVLRGIDVALEDTALPPRHLLISGGSPAPKHEAHFEAICRKIVHHVHQRRGPDFEVDIMMSARSDGAEFVKRLVDAGVAGFSLNVEVYSGAHAARETPLKQRFARPHLESMLRAAVETLGWGNGRVRSLIIPGLEPLEDTLDGVEWLASLGCSPVISPFRPAMGTQLQDRETLDPAVLHELLSRTREIVRRHAVLLGPLCVPCQHNTLSFPWDLEHAVTLRSFR